MSRPKNKTQKKIDHNLCQSLTEACEKFLEDTPGFQWITHHANYNNFPASLRVHCIFDTQLNQQQAEDNGHCQQMQQCIQSQLLNSPIALKLDQRKIFFDSEQACEKEHSGDWERRLAHH